jgi:hypothetical protein
MFNLFKKRRGTSALFDSTQYLCIAVIYTDSTDPNYTVIEKAKETLLTNLAKRNEVFTRAEIDELSEVTQLDVWKGMLWIEDKRFTQHNQEVTVTEVERWLGVRPEINNTRVPHQKIAAHFKNNHFYTMQEIRNAAAAIGFDIYSASNWQSFTKITYCFKDNGESIIAYRKKIPGNL